MLNASLPPCTFCSSEDFLHAIIHNAVELLNMFQTPKHTLLVLCRHGPGQHVYNALKSILKASRLLLLDMYEMQGEYNLTELVQITEMAKVPSNAAGIRSTCKNYPPFYSTVRRPTPKCPAPHNKRRGFGPRVCVYYSEKCLVCVSLQSLEHVDRYDACQQGQHNTCRPCDCRAGCIWQGGWMPGGGLGGRSE